MRFVLALMLFTAPVAALAGAFDVHVLGEVHDNPAHHREQARRVAEIRPRALVFEMIPADAAAEVSAEERGDADRLRKGLGWDESGWPDFSLYYPIFAAAPEAALFGAEIRRDVARKAMEAGAAAVFAGDAAVYGLTEGLSDAEQVAREALQRTAHCDALPAEMLPLMVEVQRLRDATLALMTLRALEATGGPVAVITGNGHARRDWGMPAVLARVAPEVRVHVLGQGETGSDPGGGFDEVVTAPPPERSDPCAAFR
ncbi:MAG: hypothetical protein EP318_05560 [Rhodobacteraceae bacterium]|nr:MAG: hypothetical protein EP318_05560 [Paracoccaceae bacterium]